MNFKYQSESDDPESDYLHPSQDSNDLDTEYDSETTKHICLKKVEAPFGGKKAPAAAGWPQGGKWLPDIWRLLFC